MKFGRVLVALDGSVMAETAPLDVPHGATQTKGAVR